MSSILTLQLDPASQALFEALRNRHFPPERNHIPAHLTLFHTLPDSPEVPTELASAATETSAFILKVTGIRSLGRGVAYTLASRDLHTLHARLAAAFSHDLTLQDRQRFSPHVVIQNKVTPEAARALLVTLKTTFSPFEAQAHGLDLWQYLGGPWHHLETFPFLAAEES